MSRFEVYQDSAGEWRWRLRAANHRIIAVSGEGFASAHNAHRAIRAVRHACAGRARGGRGRL